MLRVLYIDDRPADLERYAARLAFQGAKVEAKRPTNNPINTLAFATPRPDMFVLDYDLAHAQIEYQGTTLAGILRDRFPNVPIVLLTRKSLIENLELRGMEDRFDEVIFKSELEASQSDSRLKLASIAAGFERLRRVRVRDWPALLRVLDVQEKSDEDLLLKAGPPLRNLVGDALSTDASPWSLAQAARWIRSVVLHYPGILYDDLHAATALGISVESFNRQSVSKLFKRARYTGIFAEPRPTWWRSRLFSIAASIVGLAGPSASLTIAFKSALERKYHIRVRPSVCVYSRTSPADCVCFVLRKPVKREFSLPYHPDSRPAVMDEARVSYKAIRESNNVYEEFFDEQHKQLVRAIQDAEE